MLMTNTTGGHATSSKGDLSQWRLIALILGHDPVQSPGLAGARWWPL
jgi:hypothetical protein